MATFRCVTLKAASAAHMYIFVCINAALSEFFRQKDQKLNFKLDEIVTNNRSVVQY